MFEAFGRVGAARHGRLAELRDIFSRNGPGRSLYIPTSTFSLAKSPTQETAVNEVLRAKDVMIVHGPSGKQQDHYPCGSHLRDAPPREPSIGVRTK